MSTGVRVPLIVGVDVAEHLVTLLRPGCERIEIAGSIRRGRADVGDVELVAVPRTQTEPDGLFGSVEANRLSELVDRLIIEGYLRSHPTDPKRGERYSKLIEPTSGLQLDLFSARPDTFGLVYLIRTGPADYSHRFVTDLRRRSLHVANGELHRGSLGCGSYVCDIVPTPDERDVFEAADWPFVSPEHRA